MVLIVSAKVHCWNRSFLLTFVYPERCTFAMLELCIVQTSRVLAIVVLYLCVRSSFLRK